VGGPLTTFDEVAVAARGLLAQRGRVLLGLAGPPGAGKSQLAERLVRALGSAGAVVPMDGFHLDGDALVARGLADRKGAPETFDRTAYVALLERLREAAGDVRAPRFDREREEVAADAIVVPAAARLVVTEGNYLQLWPEVRAVLDEIWYVGVADDACRVEQLVARHVRFGRTPEAAREWVLRSDEANARLVAAGRGSADREVVLW
jgi:pantothenate kinase